MLSKNQFTILPDGIGELKKLKVLLVAGNPETLKEMVKAVKIQKISSHTYETGSVYLLRTIFRICDEHPCLFYMGFPLLPRPHTKTLMQAKRI